MPEITGPFEVEQLNQKIRERTIGSNWLATSDLGESLDALKRSSRQDWFWIAEIPGVIGVEHPQITERRELSLMQKLMFTLLIGVILFFGFF